MFEIPEMAILTRQMNETLKGRTIRRAVLGNSPHKFVWYNREPEEFSALMAGRVVGESTALGRWLLVNIDPGFTFVFGEMGGKILLHPAGAPIPKKYHLLWEFADGDHLSVVITMWGALELYERGLERNRPYIVGMKPTPTDPDFTPEYFHNLIAECNAAGKRSAKSLLTQEQTIPGLGNAIAQDILFLAGLHPRHALSDLSSEQIDALYRAIIDTIRDITEAGGRYDEVDLSGKPGGYIRLMDQNRRECPTCRHPVEKIAYLGGACYLCPVCQK